VVIIDMVIIDMVIIYMVRTVVVMRSASLGGSSASARLMSS
jgi:hypothetical protein